MRKDMTVHRQEAAISHFNLQHGEIQRLRRLIHEKVKPWSLIYIVSPFEGVIILTYSVFFGVLKENEISHFLQLTINTIF